MSIYIQQESHSVLVKLHPITFYRTVFLRSVQFLGWMPLFVFFGLPIVSCSLMTILLYRDACDFWHFFKQYLDTRYLVFYNPSPPRMFFFVPGPSFRISDSTWCHRTPLGHILLLNLDILQGSFRLCNWLSLRRLVLWINHLPPACWSIVWKSIFKQQLGCRFDIMDYISSFFVCLHMQLYMSWYVIQFFGFIFTS